MTRAQKNKGFNEEEDEEGKTWPQYLAVLTALLAVLLAGIHFGWPSPSLPRILSDEYPLDVTPDEASYVAVIGPIGDIFGIVIYSLLVDKIGRKYTLLLIAVPQITSMIMIYFSWYTTVLLFTGRFLGGVSEGACFTVMPIYTSEIAEAKIRGILGASFTLAVIIGFLIVNIVGSYFTIHTSALIFTVFPVLFLVGFSQMPESPYYLVMNGKVNAARESLMRLRAKRNVELELTSLTADVARQMSENGSYRDLFIIPSNRIAIMVGVILRFAQQFSGASSIGMFAQTLLKTTTDIIPEDLSAIVMLIVQGLSSVLTILIVDKVGRKPMLLISVGGCGLSVGFEAIYFGLRDYSEIDVSFLGPVAFAGFLVFMIAFSLGLGGVVNLMMGELFSASVKAKAICLMNLVFATTMFMSTRYYQYFGDTYGLAIPFATFAICQLAVFVYSYYYVPETKARTLEQIQQMLKGNP